MKKFFCFFLLCSNLVLGLELEKKMGIYVIYTPSHQEMFEEWFLPSISLEDNYEIIVECYDQECSSGSFMKDGWIETMKHKVDLVIRAIEENWGEIFIHADVDIQFFGPTRQVIEELIVDKDLLIQRDRPTGRLCAGFFVCRANEKTLYLWKDIKKRLSPNRNDQDLLNSLLRTNKYQVIWGHLPADKFMGAGTFNAKIWNPGDTLYIPRGILMHHANWTVGVENKIEQLKYVRTIVDNYHFLRE